MRGHIAMVVTFLTMQVLLLFGLVFLPTASLWVAVLLGTLSIVFALSMLMFLRRLTLHSHAQDAPPRQQTELFVRIMRMYRHRYMNYFQVFIGWLQLGQLERAMDYWEHLQVKMGIEGRMMRIDPDLAVFLLQTQADAEARGVNLEFETGQLPANCRTPYQLHAILYRLVELTILQERRELFVRFLDGRHGLGLALPDWSIDREQLGINVRMRCYDGGTEIWM